MSKIKQPDLISYILSQEDINKLYDSLNIENVLPNKDLHKGDTAYRSYWDDVDYSFKTFSYTVVNPSTIDFLDFPDEESSEALNTCLNKAITSVFQLIKTLKDKQQ